MKMINNMHCKVLGKTEAQRPCDLCGTDTLKVAVVVELECGQQIHIGRDCAAAAIHGSKTPFNRSKVDKAIREAERKALMTVRMDITRATRIQSDKKSANIEYAKRNRPIEGSYFMVRGSFVVRVD